jgi:hypothetical protein
MTFKRILAAAVAFTLTQHALGLTISTRCRPTSPLVLSASSREPSDNHHLDEIFGSRRQLLMRSILATAAATTTAFGVHTAMAQAEPTLYKTGKAPIIPGKKPKSKDDKSGTRNDPSFLRSVSDCKNQCERTMGKSTADCLSECQDICCTTYEQCTFGIVPRI